MGSSVRIQQMLDRSGKLIKVDTVKVLSTRQCRLTVPMDVLHHLLKKRPVAGSYISYRMTYDGKKITYELFTGTGE